MTFSKRIRAGGLGLVLALTACGGDAEPDAPAAAFLPTGALGADIWVADLHWETSGPPGIGEPTNLTRRPGYDNQPAFVPDGSGIWYTAGNTDAGDTDIWRYDFESERVARVTASAPESEYSAAALPDGSGVSVVRVEADSTQRLWRFDHDGTNGSVVLEDVAPVGYYAWADETTVVMFVLGDPATLQRADTGVGAAELLAEDIGRSIHRIPDSNDVSFVQRNAEGGWTIMRLPYGASEPSVIVDGVGDGEDYAWAPDGTLLMPDGGVIHAWAPGSDGWVPIADFSHLRIGITRLAVSPDGSQIAFVGEVVL